MFCLLSVQRIFFCSQIYLVFCVFHELNSRVLAATERLAASGTMVVIYVVAEQLSEEILRQGSERRRIVAVPIEAAIEGVL